MRTFKGAAFGRKVFGEEANSREIVALSQLYSCVCELVLYLLENSELMTTKITLKTKKNAYLQPQEQY